VVSAFFVHYGLADTSEMLASVGEGGRSYAVPLLLLLLLVLPIPKQRRHRRPPRPPASRLLRLPIIPSIMPQLSRDPRTHRSAPQARLTRASPIVCTNLVRSLHAIVPAVHSRGS
jgi:hypothetical protein